MPGGRAVDGLIEARWPVPERVRVVTTTRLGGVSEPPFDAFNLAHHVGDDPDRVRRNRHRLREATGLADIVWLDQQHGTRVVGAKSATAAGVGVTGDASWTSAEGLALAVLTADCVPLVVAAADASVVAVVHCGWRGTVAGVVEAALRAVPVSPGELAAWLGPGICQRCYQVGEEVRDALGDDERRDVLEEDGKAKWRMDLPGLVAHRLRRTGVQRIVASGLCSHCDPRFYSYRRDGRTGRFATLVWRAAQRS